MTVTATPARTALLPRGTWAVDYRMDLCAWSVTPDARVLVTVLGVVYRVTEVLLPQTSQPVIVGLVRQTKSGRDYARGGVLVTEYADGATDVPADMAEVIEYAERCARPVYDGETAEPVAAEPVAEPVNAEPAEGPRPTRAQRHALMFAALRLDGGTPIDTHPRTLAALVRNGWVTIAPVRITDAGRAAVGAEPVAVPAEMPADAPASPAEGDGPAALHDWAMGHVVAGPALLSVGTRVATDDGRTGTVVGGSVWTVSVAEGRDPGDRVVAMDSDGERLVWDRQYLTVVDAEPVDAETAEGDDADAEPDAETVEEAVTGYLATALWSETDDDGAPLDRTYEPSDVAAESVAQAREDVVGFLTLVGADDVAAFVSEGGTAEMLGYDFLLTRNGHGAGFWDRGLGDLGDRLTQAAKSYGSADFYVGDDGKIHSA